MFMGKAHLKADHKLHVYKQVLRGTLMNHPGYPPRNFQHKMGGHVHGINHHSVPGRVLPKKWPWVQSFSRDHSCILEGLIEYIFFHRLIL